MNQLFNDADERAPNERPVAAIAPQHIAVATEAGAGLAPLFVTGAWDAPQPKVERAVILIHGRLRNADMYFNLAQRARTAAGRHSLDTLLVVPQFLASADAQAHRVAPATLRWDWTRWMAGEAALEPAPISSFDVLDAILRQLASRERFPALSHVVIAGHSGGGQVVQRYAVLTRGEALLASLGIAVRYVIANPSSYVYFDALRPNAAGDFVPFDGAACADFNRWKYGLLDLPDYARPAARAGTAERREPDAAALEAAYARRDVLTLLGSEDCDPLHPALDISCAACAQGAHRLARGRAYARYMRMRHAQSQRHRVWEIAGVGHDGAGIFTSPEGLAALFDTAGPPVPPD